MLCIVDLLQKIHDCYRPNPESQLLEGVWDFKEWMKPFLGKVENHSKYHVFRFTKTSSKVRCRDVIIFNLHNMHVGGNALQAILFRFMAPKRHRTVFNHGM